MKVDKMITSLEKLLVKKAAIEQEILTLEKSILEAFKASAGMPTSQKKTSTAKKPVAVKKPAKKEQAKKPTATKK
ncbi:MAG: hypothetical protein FWB82_04610 [Treponema sp.]|nr:hypothetical protein [Treponema sp.]